MNDRFKFRVFNKLWGCYSMDDFYIDEDGDLNILGSEYVVEQCTGLKDKNGNLIYEGDILYVKTLDWKNKEKWNAEEVKTYWSVEYKDYLNHRGFMVFGKNRRFHKPLTKTVIFNSEAVVVGNIHENKDLLDGR